MATITFTKDSLREAIVKKGDAEVAAAHQALFDATDPDALDERLAWWRNECADILRNMMNRLDKGTATAEDFSDFEFPSKPRLASGYTLHELQRDVERAEYRLLQHTTRVNAMTGEEIALTPKQLSDYFGL